MSGYIGNPDAESEHALILSENGIAASRAMLEGNVYDTCQDCGNTINPRRVEFLRSKGMKCEYCIDCQAKHDDAPKVRMLDRIL